jgi:hypothetical protein
MTGPRSNKEGKKGFKGKETVGFFSLASTDTLRTQPLGRIANSSVTYADMDNQDHHYSMTPHAKRPPPGGYVQTALSNARRTPDPPSLLA